MDYSSSELHYVRIRGRLYGPYDIARLKQMVSRGQLSRLHDISNDGQSWEPLSNYQELFDSSPVSFSPLVYTAKSKVSELPSVDPADDDSELKLADHSGDSKESAKSKSIWYVGGVDKTVGPLDVSGIATLIRRGELKADSLVWRKGLADWVRVQDTRELSGLVEFENPERKPKRLFPQTWTNRNVSKTEDLDPNSILDRELVGELIFHASAPLPWITCMATILGIMAMVLIVGGLILLGQGVYSFQWTQILVGVSCLALSAATQIVVYFLLLYRQRMLKCRTSASFLALIFAHQALSRFWLFAGIAIIILAQIALAFFAWWLIDRQGLLEFLSGV